MIEQYESDCVPIFEDYPMPFGCQFHNGYDHATYLLTVSFARHRCDRSFLMIASFACRATIDPRDFLGLVACLPSHGFRRLLILLLCE